MHHEATETLSWLIFTYVLEGWCASLCINERGAGTTSRTRG
eukprot:COSAG01_NODE_1573_length_9865_cov_132.568503_4_plen_41_part_00